MGRRPDVVWKAYLRIDPHSMKDTPPDADPLWLGARGIEESAPVVLRLVREHVVPLVRQLKPKHFWFLVHNRESGVPTSEGDKAAYLDLTMVFDRPASAKIKSPWTMVNVVPLEVIGTDKNPPAGWKGLKTKDIHRLLHKQAELVLAFVEAHPPGFDNLEMLKHVRQFWHYVANIHQMRIS